MRQVIQYETSLTIFSLDATDRSKISSDQKRFFIALSLYPFHFSRTRPLRLQKFNKKSYFLLQATHTFVMFFSKPRNASTININRLFYGLDSRPGVYTNVYDHKDWIEAMIKVTENLSSIF